MVFLGNYYFVFDQGCEYLIGREIEFYNPVVDLNPPPAFVQVTGVEFNVEPMGNFSIQGNLLIGLSVFSIGLIWLELALLKCQAHRTYAAAILRAVCLSC